MKNARAPRVRLRERVERRRICRGRRLHFRSTTATWSRPYSAADQANQQLPMNVSPLASPATAVFRDHDLAWLEFNRRVLHEAGDERNPLLERIKFLAIAANNLDEFFMKRVGALKQKLAAQTTLEGAGDHRRLADLRDAVARFLAD